MGWRGVAAAVLLLLPVAVGGVAVRATPPVTAPATCKGVHTDDCGPGFVARGPEAANRPCKGVNPTTGASECHVMKNPDRDACCHAVATCGDIDGAGVNTVGVTDQDCGPNWTLKKSSATFMCKGIHCEVGSPTARDQNICCETPTVGCKGKMDGTRCLLCKKGDPNCVETKQVKYCSQFQCIPVLGEWSGKLPSDDQVAELIMLYNEGFHVDFGKFPNNATNFTAHQRDRLAQLAASSAAELRPFEAEANAMVAKAKNLTHKVKVNTGSIGAEYARKQKQIDQLPGRILSLQARLVEEEKVLEAATNNLTIAMAAHDAGVASDEARSNRLLQAQLSVLNDNKQVIEEHHNVKKLHLMAQRALLARIRELLKGGLKSPPTKQAAPAASPR